MVLGRRCTEVMSHFHYLLLTVCPISVIYDDVDFDLQVQVVGSAFLCSVTLNIFGLFI